jgi:hypothetical protein
MKTLFVAFVALLFAFFSGCQSSVTDPVVPESSEYSNIPEQETVAYKDVFHFTYPNEIRLTGLLYDPSYKLNNLVEIDGVARYGIKEISSGTQALTPGDIYKVSSSGTPDKKLKVDLFVDAMFKVKCPNQNASWSIKKAAEQVVTISSANQSVIYIVKYFRVKNTCRAPLNLVLTFQLDNKVLTLASMELKLVDGWSANSSEE